MADTRRIDQVLPDFAAYDAIGNHVLGVRRLLRRAGFQSDIWAMRIDPRIQHEARDYLERPDGPPGEEVLLYHQSTDCPEMAVWLSAQAERGVPLIFYYHNITPAAFFARWEPKIAAGLARARDELRELAAHTAFAIAASEYSERELRQAGYRHTAVSPLLVDLDSFKTRPDVAGRDWLFVGRVAPNKCQHDVIAAFALYRRLFDPQARLTLVGGASSARYREALDGLVHELDLAGAVDIRGAVPSSELAAHYAAAGVFVCLSEHEGFCVPVLEAMQAGVPVVAYRAAAVPETVADAGLLLDGKDPLDVASAVAALLGDDGRRQKLSAAGRERAAELDLSRSSERLLEVLTGWLSRPAVP